MWLKIITPPVKTSQTAIGKTQKTADLMFHLVGKIRRITIVSPKHREILIVHTETMQVYFERMTAVLDNPFVSKLIRVPFDSSDDKTPLNKITITKSPIWVAFLKNCAQAS